MREVCCSICNRHLGWLNDNAPTGFFYCDECKEKGE